MADSRKSLRGGDDPSDPGVMSGEAWERFCDVLRSSGRLVYGDFGGGHVYRVDGHLSQLVSRSGV